MLERRYAHQLVSSADSMDALLDATEAVAI